MLKLPMSTVTRQDFALLDDAMKARKNCTRNEHHDEEKGSVVPQASGMGLILANPLNYSS